VRDTPVRHHSSSRADLQKPDAPDYFREMVQFDRYLRDVR
jgi:hypothetical protein